MQDKTFSFGRNWQRFLTAIDEERIRTAEASLTEFLGLDDLHGKSFVDIGCGSGLFSLAAVRLGAARVVSFDIDPFSVECCTHLRNREGDPQHWDVHQGSVLDEDFLSRLGRFDITYSWGVLHHTGRMWDAVRNSAELVVPGGYYYIAVYNKILSRNGEASWIHDFWIRVKKIYNSSPTIAAYVLEPLAMSAYVSMLIAKLENPVTHIRNYKSHRGMSWKTDATDWLGGYPYEFATVEEVFTFVRSEFPDFTLANLKVTSGRGLNWYLFRRA
ncbi:MAG: class I SAM-dependent methyltransferase [Desulfomonilaceae bacterium]|nr:class I SAM-dependent methyltransferase [Desulfomonilaceae bacterium]